MTIFGPSIGVGMDYAKSPSESGYAYLWNGLVCGVSPNIGGVYGGFYDVVKRTSFSSDGTPTRAPSPYSGGFGGNSWLVDAAPHNFYQYTYSETYPVTHSIWFFSRDSTVYGDIITYSDTLGNNSTTLNMESTAAGRRLDFRRYNGASSNTTSTDQVPLNTWNHLAWIIRSTTDGEAWMNGSKVITVTTNIIAAGTITTLGIGRNKFGTSTTGSQNDARFGDYLRWNRALSKSEILSLRNGASPFIRNRRVYGNFPSGGPFPHHIPRAMAGGFAVGMN